MRVHEILDELKEMRTGGLHEAGEYWAAITALAARIEAEGASDARVLDGRTEKAERELGWAQVSIATLTRELGQMKERAEKGEAALSEATETIRAQGRAGVRLQDWLTQRDNLLVKAEADRDAARRETTAMTHDCENWFNRAAECETAKAKVKELWSKYGTATAELDELRAAFNVERDDRAKAEARVAFLEAARRCDCLAGPKRTKRSYDGSQRLTSFDLCGRCQTAYERGREDAAHDTRVVTGLFNDAIRRGNEHFGEWQTAQARVACLEGLVTSRGHVSCPSTKLDYSDGFHDGQEALLEHLRRLAGLLRFDAGRDRVTVPDGAKQPGDPGPGNPAPGCPGLDTPAPEAYSPTHRCDECGTGFTPLDRSASVYACRCGGHYRPIADREDAPAPSVGTDAPPVYHNLCAKCGAAFWSVDPNFHCDALCPKCAGKDKPAPEAPPAAPRISRCSNPDCCFTSDGEYAECPQCGGPLVPGTFVPDAPEGAANA